MKLIVDTDAGTDDAMAIFLLLRAEKMAKLDNNADAPKIIGITCVNGNTEVHKVTVNVMKVLDHVDRLDIPVFQGAEDAMLKTPVHEYYFGEDGMGDSKNIKHPPMELLKTEHAVNALVRLVNENPGEITIVALGPLTNIAMAVRMDKTFMKKVKKIIILGGTIEGKGNFLPGLEFNFYLDPEANYVVLNDCEYNEGAILLLPLEPAMNLDVTLKWRKNVLGSLKSKEIAFMNEVEKNQKYQDPKYWLFCDLVTAAIIVNNNMVTKTETYAVEAVTQGVLRGGMVVDYKDIRKSENKVNIIMGIDSDCYKETLLHYFK